MDGITSSMPMHAFPLALQLLTSVLNEMLLLGLTPDSLNVGKMTLIDKKEPSLAINSKRSLTASSIILNLFTKVIHARMDKICAKEN